MKFITSLSFSAICLVLLGLMAGIPGVIFAKMSMDVFGAAKSAIHEINASILVLSSVASFGIGAGFLGAAFIVSEIKLLRVSLASSKTIGDDVKIKQEKPVIKKKGNEKRANIYSAKCDVDIDAQAIANANVNITQVYDNYAQAFYDGKSILIHGIKPEHVTGDILTLDYMYPYGSYTGETSAGERKTVPRYTIERNAALTFARDS